MNRTIDPDEAWAHAEATYGRDAQWLLREQDERGLDVVLHLFAGYARERHGITLDATALAQADDLVRGWREQVIRPLRAVRRALRQAAAPDIAQREPIRERVKDAELRAERTELDMLCEWLGRRGA